MVHIELNKESEGSLLKYPGGKWRIAEWVISHFPLHKVYVEPFFGSGGVFFNKAPSYLETINDINGEVVNLFKVCREHAEELAKAVYFTPFSREEFKNCYQIEGDEIERARRTLVRYNQSFGTSNSSYNSWKHSQTANSPRCPLQWNEIPEKMLNIVGRLKNVQIENVNALELITRYDNADTLLYLDPPYLMGLRKRNLYKNEMRDSEHIEMLELIKRSKSRICISAYDSELYNKYLRDWYTDTKATIAQRGLPRTEKLYMNYQPSLLTI